MKPCKPWFLALIALVLIVGAGILGYLALLCPGSALVGWARAAFPHRITMITFGPYPSAEQLRRFKRQGGMYVVSLLDPRLPYEKELLEREQEAASREGLILKDFPMASVFDHRIFSDYEEEERKAADYIKRLDGPVYVHCYLGKHRVLRVRDALLAAGVPSCYWTPKGPRAEYWKLVNHLGEARRAFGDGNFPQVLSLLEPVTAKDVDVAYLRGWSHYRLGLFTQAAEDFRQGLTVDSRSRKCLGGSGTATCGSRIPSWPSGSLVLCWRTTLRMRWPWWGRGSLFWLCRTTPRLHGFFARLWRLTRKIGSSKATSRKSTLRKGGARPSADFIKVDDLCFGDTQERLSPTLSSLLPGRNADGPLLRSLL